MKKLPYGESNFWKVRTKNYFYVDKTQSIEYLENADTDYIFLLRPRRFGKSLFVSMLEYYYGIQYANDFEQLFGDLYIGKNKTNGANAYLVLNFEFSGIDTKNTAIPETINNVVKLFNCQNSLTELGF